MGKRLPALSSTPSTPNLRKRVKIEDTPDSKIEQDVVRSVKPEETDDISATQPISTASSKSPTLSKKLKQLSNAAVSPFPSHARPTANDCRTIFDLLAAVHGEPIRPEELVDDKKSAGCGA